MSLTSQLAQSDSLITLFFEKNFQNLNEHLSYYLANTYNRDFNTSSTNNDTLQSILPDVQLKYPWANTGHMIEYLLALKLGLPLSNLYPMQVMAYLDKSNFDIISSKNINFHDLSELDTLIANLLYPLSFYEGSIRKGEQKTFSSFMKKRPSQVVINDLKNLYENSILKQEIFNNPDNIFAYNPQFNPFLTKKIGGADGDLIKINKNGNFLIDLKTTKNPKLNKNMFYQLLGYVALDQTDSYNLRKMGFYLTRQNLILDYDIEEFITSHSPFENIIDFRQNFRRILTNN